MDLGSVRAQLAGTLQLIDQLLESQGLTPADVPAAPPAAVTSTSPSLPPQYLMRPEDMATEDGAGVEEVPPESMVEKARLVTDAENQAIEDGFDPTDPESMRAWRRSQADKARQRMLNSASFVAQEDTAAAAAEVVASPPKVRIAQELDEADKNTLRKAMGLLIKHRGGGPFGAGHLPRAELPALEDALKGLLEVLGRDKDIQEQDLPPPKPYATYERRQHGEGFPSAREIERCEDPPLGEIQPKAVQRLPHDLDFS